MGSALRQGPGVHSIQPEGRSPVVRMKAQEGNEARRPSVSFEVTTSPVHQDDLTHAIDPQKARIENTPTTIPNLDVNNPAKY
ncbi:hypothetical protein Bca52824_010169 [Brassica carinata]|uniref:Uncharacterized protein n=1 Tax=Brassica carinata TaxID=52824 RepID=A0A8X7WCR4_BRACI|nr:hypothetical protein Bca52824_010169 [Brassica carinata]